MENQELLDIIRSIITKIVRASETIEQNVTFQVDETQVGECVLTQ